ncbi:MAG: hypothetical protein CND86_01350 [Bacteroidetes bacterium MED-G21]|nr:MAG: hypothetical protein CND86_01350 [Bacteroidetes bacterium MED-G21]
MKMKLFIVSLSIVFSCIAQEGTFEVNDLNFRTFLQENHSEIFINDSLLDINLCSNITSIDCSSSEINNLDGIHYFENLTALNCSYNQLTQLPELPPNLITLNTSHCINLNTIESLPNTLEFIDCSYNQIIILPDLPSNLKQLYCAVNSLYSLPNIPYNLTHIDCSFNNITSLPYLPENLAHINCSYNQLTSLPDLPSNLGLLYNNPLNIFNNNIECVGDYSEIFEELLGIYPHCVDSNNIITQDVNLPLGWSIFSIYGLTPNMNLDNILNPISSDVIMAKDNYGAVYLSEYNYNGVGEIELGEAYQIKTSNATSLSLNVEYIEPETNPLVLNAGWNMIGYLRNQPALADLVLNELILCNNLILAKDEHGDVLIPSWNFNGIGNMEPGKGYQVKVEENTLLHFLPNNINY